MIYFKFPFKLDFSLLKTLYQLVTCNSIEINLALHFRFLLQSHNICIYKFCVCSSTGEKLLGFYTTEEQPSGPGGQDGMWRNEKYETVPLDVKGTDEDNSKGTKDLLYPQAAVSHNNRENIPLHSFC